MCLYWCECMLGTGLGWHPSSSSASIFGKALSLSLELTDSARLAGHQTPVSLLSPPLQHWHYRHALAQSRLSMGLEFKPKSSYSDKQRQPSHSTAHLCSKNLILPQKIQALYEKAGQSKQRFRIQGLATKKLRQAMVHSMLQITWNNYVLMTAMTWRKLYIRKGSYLNSL